MITLDWGLIDYSAAADQQLEEVEKVAAGEDDRLVFCSHPPVVTLGRGTKPEDVFSWTGNTVEVSRGGRATYHGPNQIVVYPILNLTKTREHLAQRDLRSYLAELGEAIVMTLKEFGISAEYRSLAGSDGPSVTGVWVGQKKIASIGVAVRKWVTYHGIAINVDEDLTAFQGINPCGFQSKVMTSIEEVLGQKPDRKNIAKVLEQSLRSRLE